MIYRQVLARRTIPVKHGNIIMLIKGYNEANIIREFKDVNAHHICQ